MKQDHSAAEATTDRHRLFTKSLRSVVRLVAAFLALGILALGCVSEKKAAYQRLADEVNPIFVTLILKVSAIKAQGPNAYDTDARLAAACAGAETELSRLSEIDFDKEESIHSHGRNRYSFDASGMIQFRHAMCGWPQPGTPPTSFKPVNGTSKVLGNCRWWCLDQWSYFTGVAREFAAGAEAEGVQVIALPHVAPPGESRP